MMTSNCYIAALTVVFLCPYGGAKSVVAASYFNRLAGERRLPFVAIAAAAGQPYDAVPPPVADALARDGFDVHGFKPRCVLPQDRQNAVRVIAIDCGIAAERADERWDDVPKISEDLDGSIAAIRRHVEQLANELAP